jgi:hypothetical protein
MGRQPTQADCQKAMHDAPTPHNEGRGAELLLTHCTALTRVDPLALPAFDRLEAALGCELARMLVVALAGRRSERVLAA